MLDARSFCRTALLALVASIMLLVSTDARAGGCKSNGTVCSTDISCCSRNCAKPVAKKSSRPAMFGLCCAPRQRVFNGTCCTPATSCPAGSCGMVSDGCGGTLNCGGCDASECLTCVSNACVSKCTSEEVCDDAGNCETTTTTTTTTTMASTTTTTMCTPNSCTDDDCGQTSDGCGGTLDCPCNTICTVTCNNGATFNTDFCTSAAECATSCSTFGSPCVSQGGVRSHACVACCPSGQVTCCPSGFTGCDPSCTDTQTDSNNCGTCGTACSAEQDCDQGSCVTPTTTTTTTPPTTTTTMPTCVFECPPVDLAGRSLLEHSTTTELFCRYQAVPNDFFCKYFLNTGLLKQDADQGFCPPVAIPDCTL